jgi:hypothetical protein
MQRIRTSHGLRLMDNTSREIQHIALHEVTCAMANNNNDDDDDDKRSMLATQ